MSITAALKELAAVHVPTKELETTEASLEAIDDSPGVDVMEISPQSEKGKAPGRPPNSPFPYEEYEDPTIEDPDKPEDLIPYTKEESKMLREHLVQFWGKNLTAGQFRRIFTREMKQAARNRKIDKEAVRMTREYEVSHFPRSARDAYNSRYY